MREVFAHGYSILSHDIGSPATNISVRNSAERVSRGSCIAIFDNTYGSLRFTEKLYLEFETILELLRVAAETQTSQGVEDFQDIVRQIREEYSTFAPGTALAALAGEARAGYEQVFAPGSRVLFRSAGQIASEVEIIDVSIIDGILRYRVSAPANLQCATGYPRRLVNHLPRPTLGTMLGGTEKPKHTKPRPKRSKSPITFYFDRRRQRPVRWT